MLRYIVRNLLCITHSIKKQLLVVFYGIQPTVKISSMVFEMRTRNRNTKLALYKHARKLGAQFFDCITSDVVRRAESV